MRSLFEYSCDVQLTPNCWWIITGFFYEEACVYFNVCLKWHAVSYKAERVDSCNLWFTRARPFPQSAHRVLIKRHCRAHSVAIKPASFGRMCWLYVRSFISKPSMVRRDPCPSNISRNSGKSSCPWQQTFSHVKAHHSNPLAKSVFIGNENA